MNSYQLKEQEIVSVECYKNLQQQLNHQHKRLMRERQQMLERESDRLQVYQKLDLVEFFNYSPSKSQNKQSIMYHLSEKFKDYMRKLTENNVYKRQGYLMNENVTKESQSSIDARRQLFTQKFRTQQEQHKRNDQLNGRNVKEMSNVQRNSELGKMFQTMRYYGQKKQYKQDNIARQLIQKSTNSNENDLNGNDNYQHSKRNSLTSKQTHKEINSLRAFPPLLLAQPLKVVQQQHQQHCDNNNSVPCLIPNCNTNGIDKQKLSTEIEQLKGALAQQQKIYLLTELNHYIKLYKQSSMKQHFLNKHLQNLHQYILQIKLNQCQQKESSYSNTASTRSKSKSKYNSKNSYPSYEFITKQSNSKLSTQQYHHQQQNQMIKHQHTALKQQNAMLKKQMQIYINQLNAINAFTQQDFPQQNYSSNRNLQYNKCPQAKKVDRFKQFAQHIRIMQLQLDNLINTVHRQQQQTDTLSLLSPPNKQQFNPTIQLQINELNMKIASLQGIIDREENQKGKFFQEVKKFKQLMNIKNQQIATLQSQLQSSQTLINQLKNQKDQLCISMNKRSLNKSKKQQISQFINRTLKNPSQQIIQSKHFRESAITTNPSTEFEFKYSRPQSNSSKYTDMIQNKKSSLLNQNINSLLSNSRINKVSYYQPYLTEPKNRVNYHKDNNYSYQQNNTRNSRSKSNYSVRTGSKDSYWSKSKTDYFDSYEPKPYQRYNKLSDDHSYNQLDTQGNLLYQRINDYQ